MAILNNAVILFKRAGKEVSWGGGEFASSGNLSIKRLAYEQVAEVRRKVGNGRNDGI